MPTRRPLALRPTAALLPGLAMGLASGLAILGPAEAGDTRSAPREANAEEIRAFIQAQGKTVLSFVGHSAAGYEDEAALLAAADAFLAQHDAQRTLVNIGATAAGIGAVYPLAKRRGFVTMGIVSTLARDAGEPLSPFVDHVFFVRDDTWGGRLPDLPQLSPASVTLVALSQTIVGIGGGEIARDEMLAARAAGRQVVFRAADMNHRIARERALAKGQPVPQDFRGAAYAALADTADTNDGKTRERS